MPYEHAYYCTLATKADIKQSRCAVKTKTYFAFRVDVWDGAGDNPLSGASRFRGSGHDIDIYAFGREAAPLVAECKARGNGGGFVQLERWLGEYDLLVLKRNYADPLVLLPWRVWTRLLERVRR